jgi:hypothetical protein
VISSLSTIVLMFILIIFGNFIGIPFDSGQQEKEKLVQLFIPVFVGYLISASFYIFRDDTIAYPEGERGTLLKLVLYGGYGVFVSMFLVILAAFTWSDILNKKMEFDSVYSLMVVALTVLNATMTIVTNALLGGIKNERQSNK